VPPAHDASPPNAAWPAGNEIDRFLQAKLADKHLAPAPEEVSALVADESPDACLELLDRRD
jgi:hypothetical protein